MNAGSDRSRRDRRLATIALALVAIAVAAWWTIAGPGRMPTRARASGTAFLVDPYVQLGDAPAPGAAERLDVLWQADDSDVRWSVAIRDTGPGAWRKAARPACRRDS